MSDELVRPLAVEGQTLVSQIAGLVVVDDPSFQRAGEWLKTVKLYLRRVNDVFNPIVESAWLTHKTAVAQRKNIEQYALTAERILKDRMSAYEQEQARIRQEAERLARQEQERLEAEERSRVAVEEARLLAEAEERRLAEAVAAEQAGDKIRAQALIETPILVAPVAPRPVFVPPPPMVAPTVEGVSFRDAYTAEVVDFLALIRAVAAGQAPITLLQVNTTALNGMARSLKDALNLPGVRVVSSRVVSVAGKT